MAKKRILLLYTGGTIGMVRSEKGYVPDGRSFRETLEAIPDLHFPESPDWELLSFSPLLDSCDIAVNEWNQMGRAIAENYEAYDGFVVLHGTDTMAYSASALSYMLENLAKPVIFTGAQIPLCELRSDGRSNIVNALALAASGRVREVGLYFDGKLLRGNRSTKRSSDRLAAFESPNAPCLAEAGIRMQFFPVPGAPEPQGPFRLQELKELPVGVLKIFPGIQFEIFEPILTEKLRGVVLGPSAAATSPAPAALCCTSSTRPTAAVR